MDNKEIDRGNNREEEEEWGSLERGKGGETKKEAFAGTTLCSLFQDMFLLFYKCKQL